MEQVGNMLTTAEAVSFLMSTWNFPELCFFICSEIFIINFHNK